MNENILKPCPFCSGAAKRFEIAEGANAGGDVITCEKCLCSSCVEFGEKTGLVDAWNNRAAGHTASHPVATADLSAALAVIQYVLDNPIDGIEFLERWNEGDFEACRREWPDAPADCYIGADPLLPGTQQMLAAQPDERAAPKRAVQFRIDIQADTTQDLAGTLSDLATRVDRDELSGHSISGGYNSGYEHWLTISDHPTHDEYVAQLNAYLDTRRNA